MARMTKAEKALETAFTAAFKVHGNCVEFNVFDLGKIHNESLDAARNGGSMEEAVKAAVAKYRQN
jgi:hypothetical protein